MKTIKKKKANLSSGLHNGKEKNKTNKCAEHRTPSQNISINNSDAYSLKVSRFVICAHNSLQIWVI